MVSFLTAVVDVVRVAVFLLLAVVRVTASHDEVTGPGEVSTPCGQEAKSNTTQQQYRVSTGFTKSNLSGLSHLKVRTKVHVFAFDSVSFGFTLHLCKLTKDLYVTKTTSCRLPTVVTDWLVDGLPRPLLSSPILSLRLSFSSRLLLSPRATAAFFLFRCVVEKRDTGTSLGV